MPEALGFSFSGTAFPSLRKPNPSPSLDFPSLSRLRKFPPFPHSSAKTSIALPANPSKAPPPFPSLPLPPSAPTPTPPSDFQEKMLFLESIGIDLFRLLADHPPIVSASLSAIKSTLDFLSSLGFSALDLRRIVGMCPEILDREPSDVVAVVTFLFREARVEGSRGLRRAVSRRPRLLACGVENRLRPTLYFLQSIGIAEVSRHTYLLSCSVEDKLIPRIECLEKIGFSRADALSMVRRFPPLFCYSIKDNLELKFNYFVVEMGRDLRELKEFPQYFSFSLENRIKPRHQCCVEKGVCFPLHVMLKTSEVQFHDRLDACCDSSLPRRNSPLWCTKFDID